MMDLISQDKKVKRGQLTFILVRGIGQAFVTRDIGRTRSAPSSLKSSTRDDQRSFGLSTGLPASLCVLVRCWNPGNRETAMSDTIFNLLMALFLLGANAFYVAAEVWRL